MLKSLVSLVALALTFPASASDPYSRDATRAGQSQATHVASGGTDEPSSSGEGLRGLLLDPQDGKLDMSRWLLEHRGFVPVPIIVSDAALDYGGGLALAFFHRPAGAATTRRTVDGRQQMVPPNIGVRRTHLGARRVVDFADRVGLDGFGEAGPAAA